MSEQQASRLARVGAALEGLSERERRLVALMLVVVGMTVVVLTTYGVTTALSSRDEAIESKRAALQLLIEQRDTFVAASTEAAAIREQLSDNNLRLSTFIEGRAAAAGIPRPREFDDSTQPLEGNITAEVTSAEFASLSFAQLQSLMSAIEGTDELVYVQQLAFSPARRGAEGLQLEVTLRTYKRERSR
ncbi:MAG: hypothetical protein H6697_00295 [Myxococcales bacterium]|nr:hypothetical protein [Myxococcales bacterium]MCB9520052.1 hypothetical protein [Myxococcales bacterium]